MKHNKKITIIILIMFLIAQFIGLYVVNTYAQEKVVNGEIVNKPSYIVPVEMENRVILIKKIGNKKKEGVEE